MDELKGFGDFTFNCRPVLCLEISPHLFSIFHLQLRTTENSVLERIPTWLRKLKTKQQPAVTATAEIALSILWLQAQIANARGADHKQIPATKPIRQ